VRMPDGAAAQTVVAGVTIRRLAVAPHCNPVPMVLAAVTSHLRQFGDAPGSVDVGL
jgi:hypothetical protein